MSADAVPDYLASIRSFSVLDRCEVQRLCRAIEIGLLAAEQLDRTPVGADDVRDLRSSAVRASARSGR